MVGMPHEIKGTGIAAFCTLEPHHQPADDAARDALVDKLRAHVADEIGAIAKPDMIRFTSALPKTRSGKIMRRLLRDIAAGVDSNQDMTTLEDKSVLAQLRGKHDLGSKAHRVGVARRTWAGAVHSGDRGASPSGRRSPDGDRSWLFPAG